MYKISFFCWHGLDQKLVDKLAELFPEGEWSKVYAGYEIDTPMSLDEVLKRWKAPMMVFPEEHGVVMVAVTQHANFNQR